MAPKTDFNFFQSYYSINEVLKTKIKVIREVKLQKLMIKFNDIMNSSMVSPIQP